MLVVWQKTDNSLYYRYVKGYYCSYEVGYINQYNHKVILVIKGFRPYTKDKFSKKLAKKLVRFLNRV